MLPFQGPPLACFLASGKAAAHICDSRLAQGTTIENRTATRQCGRERCLPRNGHAVTTWPTFGVRPRCLQQVRYLVTCDGAAPMIDQLQWLEPTPASEGSSTDLPGKPAVQNLVTASMPG